MRTGLFGGTFSPPHNGHIRAAELFFEKMLLDRLVVMPAGIPPHKNADPGADTLSRLDMSREAFGAFAQVSDYEISKLGKSYTSETLEYLKRKYPTDELYMLVGEDMFLSLDTWHEPEKVFGLCTVVCLRRSHSSDRQIELAQKKYTDAGASVCILWDEPLQVSSTDIRELCRRGGNISGLVPAGVARIIKERELYGSGVHSVNITDEMLESLRDRVKNYLTKKRYAHTLAVEEEAAELGKIYLPDSINELRAAALLHDITKRLDLEKQLNLCVEFDIMVSDTDKMAPKIFHAKTAAAVVQRDFPEFADSRVVSGIRWHTTGRAGMSVFEAIIYLADYIEKTRTFPDCVTLRSEFYSGLSLADTAEKKDILLKKTMIRSFDMTIRCLVDEGALIDKDTVEARNWYLCSIT